MFDQQQIIEFKEAFSIMDADHDGFVCAEDLEEVFQQLGRLWTASHRVVLKVTDRTILSCYPECAGQPATPQQIQKMLSETPGAINFTVFLTLMGEKLSGTDPENEILQAFAAFDDTGKGYINAEDLREFMTTMGDRFTDEEVDIMFKGSPVDEYGNFNYREFVRVLKHGE